MCAGKGARFVVDTIGTVLDGEMSFYLKDDLGGEAGDTGRSFLCAVVAHAFAIAPVRKGGQPRIGRRIKAVLIAAADRVGDMRGWIRAY